MTTKTLSDFISEGYTYPEIIPLDLQELITEWYQFRHVVDDDKFTVFFDRMLKHDYHHYYELLRIEPGISEYDWLVSQYRELQREDMDTRTDTLTAEGTESATVNDTETLDDTKTTTYNILDANEASRTNTAGKTITDVIARDDTVVTDTDTTNLTENDSKHADKILPMSADGSITTTQTGEIGALSWNTASGQNQTTTKENGTGTVDTTETLDSDETRTRTETNSGGYTDASEKTKTGTETVVDGSEKTGEKTSSVQRSNESTKASAGTGRTREIMTGRSGQIAIMLANAQDFIMKSDAWTWLQTRIDTCFMGVYDV